MSINYQINEYDCEVAILAILQKELAKMERSGFEITDPECKEELSDHIMLSIKNVIDKMIEQKEYSD